MRRIENFIQFVLIGIAVGIILDHVPRGTDAKPTPTSYSQSVSI